MSIEPDDWSAWRGRAMHSEETLGATPVQALAAVLDIAPSTLNAAALAPLWHWLFFLPKSPQAALGNDGHPQRGDFLPPVPLPQRMWAGGRLSWMAPMQIGQHVRRTSIIADITSKQGRSGPLVFVTMRHEFDCAGTIVLVEEQDIVYRGAALRGDSAIAPVPAAVNLSPQYSRMVTPDPVLLFRYSALTFNAHRIHYDRDYARQAEGYPGLVVHGPLIATLLVDLLHRQLPAARLAQFSFRAVSPLYDTAPFRLCCHLAPDGRNVTLWAENPDGAPAMTATAILA